VIRSAPGRSRFGASASSRSLTFSSLAASLASVAACRYRRCPSSLKTARLDQAGVLVRERFSVKGLGQVTGYSVALPGDTTRDDGPAWYGGGKLAADLSWPGLRQRWTPTRAAPGRPRLNLTAGERNAARDHATRAAAGATVQIGNLARTDQAAAADAAWATAGALHVASLRRIGAMGQVAGQVGERGQQPGDAGRGRISELSRKQHGQQRSRPTVPRGARRPSRSTASSRTSTHTYHSSGPHRSTTVPGSHGHRSRSLSSCCFERG
jgi:hypothetical protein